MRKENTEIQCAVCPQCMKGSLTSHWLEGIFRCSHCGSGIWHTSKSRLMKMSVKPVSDISSYPEVVAQPWPHCDCEERMYIECGGFMVTPRYCSIHNVIVIEGVFDEEDLETISEWTLEVINHETLHWVLCKNFNDSISNALDKALSQLD